MLESDATAVAGGFPECAARGANAGFAARETFQNRQAKTFDQGRINRERAGRVSRSEGRVVDGTRIAKRAPGGLERLHARERGTSGLRVR